MKLTKNEKTFILRALKRFRPYLMDGGTGVVKGFRSPKRINEAAVEKNLKFLRQLEKKLDLE